MAIISVTDCRSRPAALLFHLAAASMFGYAQYWQANNRMYPVKTTASSAPYISRFVYLTYWNNWFQFLTYSIFLLSDPLSWFMSRSPLVVRLLKGRDLIFNGIAHPMGYFVQITFWAIYAFDRELIFPKAIEPYYPPWINHVTHSAMIPCSLIELLLVRHAPPKRYIGLTPTLFIMLAYTMWTLFLGLYADFWVYPVMQVLPPVGRGAFILLCIFLALSMYFLGEAINTRMWPGSGRRGGPSSTGKKPNAKKSK